MIILNIKSYTGTLRINRKCYDKNSNLLNIHSYKKSAYVLGGTTNNISVASFTNVLFSDLTYWEPGNTGSVILYFNTRPEFLKFTGAYNGSSITSWEVLNSDMDVYSHSNAENNKRIFAPIQT